MHSPLGIVDGKVLHVYSTGEDEIITKNILGSYNSIVIDDGNYISSFSEAVYNDIIIKLRKNTANIGTIPKSMDDNELFCSPLGGTAMIIVYNLGTNDNLLLSPSILSDIYTGKITNWQQLSSNNPNVPLPDQKINFIVRDDQCGSNMVLNTYIQKQSGAFQPPYGIKGAPVSNYSKKSTSPFEMLTNIIGQKYSLGYLSLHEYKAWCEKSENVNRCISSDINIAKFNQGVGQVEPNDHSIALAIQAWRGAISPTIDVVSNMTVSSLFQHSGWPLTTPYFMCVNKMQASFDQYIGITQFFSVVSKLIDEHNLEQPNIAYFDREIYGVINDYLSNELHCSNTKKKCIDSNPSPNSIVYVIVAIGIVLTVLCLLIISIAGLLYYYCKRQKPSKYEEMSSEDMSTQVDEKTKLLSSSGDDLQNTVTLGDHIGHGSFADVYRGQWLGQDVGIKRILLSSIKNHNMSTNLPQEMRILQSLSHPNVIRYFHGFIKGDHLLLVIELCDKGDLRSILQNKNISLTMAQRLDYCLDIAYGLHYLHTKSPPIIHRDLKTANLLVDEHDEVKIADFGMSRIMDIKRTEMTMCGTAETCAPEVLSKQIYTYKADIFSFGVIIWEIMTRRPVYKGMNFYSVVHKVVNDDLRPDITKEDYDVIPESVINCIKSCWDKDPSIRPNTGTIIKTLESVLQQMSSAQVRTRKPVDTSIKPMVRKPLHSVSPLTKRATYQSPDFGDTFDSFSISRFDTFDGSVSLDSPKFHRSQSAIHK